MLKQVNKINIIIPVRGGSKRIKNKNLIDINGIPLLWYSLLQCKEIQDKCDIYVATDSLKIIASVKTFIEKYNCENIFIYKRNKENCSDIASTEDCIKDFFKNIKIEYEKTLLIQATSPMILIEDILNVIYALDEYDSVLTVCEDSSFRWKFDTENGGYKSIDYNIDNRPRSQDINRYKENGAIYGFSKWLFIRNNNRLYDNIGIYVMPQNRSFEIDTYEDLELIRKII